MPVVLTDLSAELTGHISIEDAEPLYQWLLEHPEALVILNERGHLHTAIWQLLLVFRPRIQINGMADDVSRRWLMPELFSEE